MALKALEKVWRSKNIEIETKKKVLQTCVFSNLRYGYTSITQLLSKVNQVSQLKSSNNLFCLNTCKTEFLIIGLHVPAQMKKLYDPSIHLSNNSSTFTSDAPVSNLGVTFDPDLSFSNHISNLSRSYFMHTRDLHRIRPMLDF